MIAACAAPDASGYTNALRPDDGSGNDVVDKVRLVLTQHDSQSTVDMLFTRSSSLASQMDLCRALRQTIRYC
jgi:hypothetical protein